jgi:hypothetical protein
MVRAAPSRHTGPKLSPLNPAPLWSLENRVGQPLLHSGFPISPSVAIRPSVIEVARPRCRVHSCTSVWFCAPPHTSNHGRHQLRCQGSTSLSPPQSPLTPQFTGMSSAAAAPPASVLTPDFYYPTFDNDRASLQALYVRAGAGRADASASSRCSPGSRSRSWASTTSSRSSRWVVQRA